MQDEVTIEKHTPVDGNFYFICKGKMLLAKTWTQEEANIIASAFSLRAELERVSEIKNALESDLINERMNRELAEEEIKDAKKAINDCEYTYNSLTDEVPLDVSIRAILSMINEGAKEIIELDAELEKEREQVRKSKHLLEAHEPHGHNFTNEQYVNLRERTEQANAQAAAMREAAINVLSVKYCQITYEDQRNIMALERTLSSDAGAALLEEVRRLREIEALLIENKDLANQYNESDAVRKIDALLRKEGDYETE